MSLPMLTSTTNEIVKKVVRLHDARERKETQRFIIEGERAVSMAFEAGCKIEKIFSTQEKLPTAKSLVSGARITLASSEVMKKMSTATTPSGILGVFAIPVQPSLDMLTAGLVLAQVQDPGNMGTLIRTAAACGVKSIVIIEGADPWSPKVVQASAGTITMVNIFQLDWHTLVSARNTLKLAALVISGGSSISSLDANTALIVVGNEAHGIPLEWQQDCDTRVTLPMPGGAESLNAGVAGALAVYLTFCKQLL